ncbi:MAG: hypothetical protein GY822_04115 [Deltaproteobacteria bacterium]|nr:hypothetical protein [Deltaproteobacteria bacterium]
MRPIERLISERVVVTVIALNTLAILLRAFPFFKTHFSVPLFWLDYVTTIFFVFELIIKLRLWGKEKYFASGWNQFDFAVVMLSSPLLLTPVLDFHGFGAILVLRVGRLLRFFRLLRFVPDADRLSVGIQRGLKASIGVLVALALYNGALGLAACYLFGSSHPDLFGDPFRSIYSIFRVFTVEGWYEIPEMMTGNDYGLRSWLIRLFFVFCVSTGGLLGLSMANAVFVDEMVMDNNEHIEKEVAAIAEKLTLLSQDTQLLLDENRALRQSNEKLFSKIEGLITKMTSDDVEK